MYVVLEGIKGCGKSIIYERICQCLRIHNVRFVSLRSTRRLPGFSFIETMHDHTSQWWPDWAIERLYALRSNTHAAASRSASMILGERSILTSYVTRWDAENPQRRIQRVKRLERLITEPDHVIYLDVPVEIAVSRISARPARNYGLADQTKVNLQLADERYKTLASDGQKYGLGPIRWHWVDATQPVESIVQLVLKTLQTIPCAHRTASNFYESHDFVEDPHIGRMP